jgi:hypothetical protein
MSWMDSATVNFWIALAVTIDTGVAGGTVHLTNMVPENWIPTVTAWGAFWAFAGTCYLTAVHARGMAQNKS